MRSFATIVTLMLAGCAPMTAEDADRSYRAWQAVQQSQAQARASAPAPYMLPTQPVQQYQPQAYHQYQSATYQPYQAPAAMAMFTGGSKPVQTITNQSGWECTYQYNGQSFTRVFTSPCPSSVAVR